MMIQRAAKARSGAASPLMDDIPQELAVKIFKRRRPSRRDGRDEKSQFHHQQQQKSIAESGSLSPRFRFEIDSGKETFSRFRHAMVRVKSEKILKSPTQVSSPLNEKSNGYSTKKSEGRELGNVESMTHVNSSQAGGAQSSLKKIEDNINDAIDIKIYPQAKRVYTIFLLLIVLIIFGALVVSKLNYLNIVNSLAENLQMVSIGVERYCASINLYKWLKMSQLVNANLMDANLLAHHGIDGRSYLLDNLKSSISNLNLNNKALQRAVVELDVDTTAIFHKTLNLLIFSPNGDLLGKTSSSSFTSANTIVAACDRILNNLELNKTNLVGDFNFALVKSN